MIAQSFVMAQDLPPCMTGMKRTNTAFIKKMKLRDGRSVYAFTVKRPPKCMDCPSGMVYYDSACTTVASFTIGYAPMASIHPGYSPSDFPEAGSPIFAARLAAQAIPPCITAAMTKPDSLKNAGITNIDEVLLGGRRLYHFQIPAIVKEGCYDCATPIVYYDSTCNVAARFLVGGYAGVEAPPGFTRQDFMNKRKLRTIWSSGADTTTANPPATMGTAVNPFPRPVSFVITQVADTVMRDFKEGDELRISTAEGLYHLRKGKLVNRYKIIPQKIKQQKINPCLVPPCPVREEEKMVYYLEPLQRYLYIEEHMEQASLNFSGKIMQASNKSVTFKEADWKAGYRLRKK